MILIKEKRSRCRRGYSITCHITHCQDVETIGIASDSGAGGNTIIATMQIWGPDLQDSHEVGIELSSLLTNSPVLQSGNDLVESQLLEREGMNFSALHAACIATLLSLECLHAAFQILVRQMFHSPHSAVHSFRASNVDHCLLCHNCTGAESHGTSSLPSVVHGR